MEPGVNCVLDKCLIPCIISLAYGSIFNWIVYSFHLFVKLFLVTEPLKKERKGTKIALLGQNSPGQHYLAMWYFCAGG